MTGMAVLGPRAHRCGEASPFRKRGRGVIAMARPLVHRTVHKQDRPGFQKVMVAGQADALHVRAIKEVPVAR
jgi:hypothetical protein